MCVMNTDELREKLMKQGLNQSELDANPFKQFEIWYQQSIETDIYEPGAMTLATVDKSGQPWQRIVLLKIFDEKGFVFFTNYESRKAQQIAVNPKVSLLFPWHALGRQAKITGDNNKGINSGIVKIFYHAATWQSDRCLGIESEPDD